MSREKIPNIPTEKLEKAVKSARKLINVLAEEAKNPMSHKPLRFGVIVGGITYAGYLYYRGRDSNSGQFRAGAWSDDGSLEMSGTFEETEAIDENGNMKMTIEPTVDTLRATDEDLDKLGSLIDEAQIEPYLSTPQSDG